MQTLYRNLAWKIMNLRYSQELTQDQFGKKLGLSRYQVQRLENGFGDTTLENLRKVSDYFEMPMEDLFKFEEKVPLDIYLRTETDERSSSGQETRKFSKPFYENTQIKMITVKAKTIRLLKVEKHHAKDLILLEGRITVNTPNDFIPLKTHQVLSCHGVGNLKITNSSDKSSLVMVITI